MSPFSTNELGSMVGWSGTKGAITSGSCTDRPDLGWFSPFTVCWMGVGSGMYRWLTRGLVLVYTTVLLHYLITFYTTLSDTVSTRRADNSSLEFSWKPRPQFRESCSSTLGPRGRTVEAIGSDWASDRFIYLQHDPSYEARLCTPYYVE